MMAIAVVFAALVGVMTLAAVGLIAYGEARPMIASYRQARARRNRNPRQQAAQQTREAAVLRAARDPRRHGRDDASRFVVSLLMGLGLIALGAWEWSNFEFRGEWRAAQGEVLSTSFEAVDENSDTLRAAVRYSYRVNGTDYTSLWMDGDQSALLTGITTQDAFIARYQPGDAVTVWYHPLLPTFPSLGRITTWYVFVALAAGGVVVLTSVLSGLAGLREKPHRHQPKRFTLRKWVVSAKEPSPPAPLP